MAANTVYVTETTTKDLLDIEVEKLVITATCLLVEADMLLDLHSRYDLPDSL